MKKRAWLGSLCLSLLVPGCGDAAGVADALDAGNAGRESGADDGGDQDAAAEDASSAGGDADKADGGADAEDAMNCGASPFQAERVHASVLLVIDKSGSMNKTPAGFTHDKWTALTGALEQTLTSVRDDLSFGVDLYPAGADACDVLEGPAITVGVDQGAAQVEQIVKLLEETTPGGATPTAAALARALAFYTSGAGAALEGDRYVLLATDGGPNCNDSLACEKDACTANLEGACFDASQNCCSEAVGGPGAHRYCLDGDDTLGAVQALADAGVPSVVVGIPGSEAFAPLLDALAVAGGMPSDGATRYFAVTADGVGAGSLADVLERVTRQLIRTCDLQLGSVPPDLGKLNVELDGAPVPRDSADGWELDESTTPPTIRLKGATCAALEAEGAERVDVTFGCPTFTLL